MDFRGFVIYFFMGTPKNVYKILITIWINLIFIKAQQIGEKTF